MKTFVEYLTEAKKTYKFKFGVAGELPEGFIDSCESCLQKFGLINMTPGKKTPIQERPLDFPKLQNVETTYFEAESEINIFVRSKHNEKDLQHNYKKIRCNRVSLTSTAIQREILCSMTSIHDTTLIFIKQNFNQ